MQNASQIKERLYHKISHVDDVELLKEIEEKYFPEQVVFGEDEKFTIDNDTLPYLSKEDIENRLNERAANYKSGIDKPISTEEFKATFKDNYGV